MGSIKTAGDSVYRDYVTDGVPASGENPPAKSDIRALFALLDAGLTNRRIAKTADYTVGNADKNATLALGGTAFFTLTLGAASGYDADFQIRVLNEDTARGKLISINGIADFILWPLQTVEVYASNNVWQRAPLFQRWGKQGFKIYANSGASATNFDGQVAGTGSAKKTIQACVDTILQFIDNMGSSPTIEPIGSFAEGVNLSGALPTGTFVLFQAAAAGTCTWSSGPTANFCLFPQDIGIAIIQNIDFVRGSLTNVALLPLHQDAIFDLGNPSLGNSSGCTFADPGTGGTAMSADHGGASLNINGSWGLKAGNYGVVISLGGGCSATHTGGVVITIAGTPTIGTFVQLTGSGANMAFASGVTSSGSVAAGGAKYLVSLNASLSLSGFVPPGTVAGSATAGGQVI